MLVFDGLTDTCVGLHDCLHTYWPGSSRGKEETLRSRLILPRTCAAFPVIMPSRSTTGHPSLLSPAGTEIWAAPIHDLPFSPELSSLEMEMSLLFFFQFYCTKCADDAFYILSGQFFSQDKLTH